MHEENSYDTKLLILHRSQILQRLLAWLNEVPLITYNTNAQFGTLG